MDTIQSWLRDHLGHLYPMFEHNPNYWGGVFALAIAISLIAGYMTRRMEAKLGRTLSVLGTFATCILLGFIVGASLFLEETPRESETPLAETDPVPVVQEGIVEGMNRLADATRVETHDKRGNKRYEMEWSPRLGYQPVAEICDMGICAEAMTYSVQVLNAAWQDNPEAVRGNGTVAAAYNHVSKNLVTLSTGFEPFMAARLAKVIAGNHEMMPGNGSEAPILVWINTSSKDEDPQTGAEWSVPYKAAIHFDSVCAWLTAYFGVSAYPHVARLNADFLDGEGLGWRARVPANPGFYADNDMIQSWDPSGLPESMQQILTAIRETGELPKELFWERSEILIKGCEGTLFKGKGFGHNLGVLLWGPYFESYFVGDTIKAARAAAFLAANPKARFQQVPSFDDGGETKVFRDANRRYVTFVANWWYKLPGFRPFEMGWVKIGSKTKGIEDPSMGFLQFLCQYTTEVLPPNGKIPTNADSELKEISRWRNLLPKQPKLADELMERMKSH